ncbi:MAG TPA: acyl-CoA dehydrogenase family protein [Frankiaceae bacterium]|nr:acyl-CoA dehydrogenase family protein [Frankiaceae bacterium]
MDREPYEPEHEAFRSACRTFLERQCVPHHKQWEADGIVPRDVWIEAGKQGLLGMGVPEEFGGGGVSDFRYNVVLGEEIARARCSGVGFPLHNDVVEPYLLRLATQEQKERWLPGFCSGEIISAIAMTEPGAGSDLQGIRTTAVKEGTGADAVYVVNGSKTFITNGINADLVITVVKTDPAGGAKGTSLLVIERDMPGFTRGRNLEKIGLKAQDTAELFFDDVRVPACNLLGQENGGFFHLMEALPQERLAIAVYAVAAVELVLEETLKYCKTRTAFGKPIGSFQNTRFTLAEMATEATIARAFLDKCIRLHGEGQLSIPDAAMAKWWTTELQTKVVNACLQLYGGYGYMSEYPIAQAFIDSRIQTIYGGTTEIMKEIVGRSMGV